MGITHDPTIIDDLHFNYFLDALSQNGRINNYQCALPKGIIPAYL